ncbi:Uncharacterised protein [Mycobacteroides abscessus subsp. massiliense]|nr:Uncharacterised protein [Mycobacteroides abscessus subsp. massiliense]
MSGNGSVCQHQGAGYRAQIAGPPGGGLGGVLSVEPGDVVAIGPHCWQPGYGPSGLVDGEQLAEEDRDGPAIHQDVMTGDNHSVS